MDIFGNIENSEDLDLLSKDEIIQKIWSLKLQLQESDYKIIKCYEAQLGNEDMPYNLQELLTERKTCRNLINTLEFKLAMLN